MRAERLQRARDAGEGESPARAPELCVVVPTFKERENIRPLIAGLGKALEGIAWEAVFVDDDSPDGTADLVREIARGDPRIRVLQRVGRRGLASAAVEGMMATAAPFVAVMDADLQHDETVLPAMLERLKAEDLDIVIGSRYAAGGSTGDWDARRLFLSRLATRLGQKVMRAKVSDPMSGYFVLRRAFLDDVVRELSGKGFKILLDLFTSSPRPVRFAEVPFHFRSRHAGESKLDVLVVREYFLVLAEKLIGHVLPVRFVMFAAVGLSGLVFHLAILGGLLLGAGVPFLTAQVVASLAAMTTNFALNNLFTYRDKRYRGAAWLRALLTFYLACSIGLVGNMAVADFLFANEIPWWLAGAMGGMIGAVWNFAVTSTFTWQVTTRQRRAPQA